MADQGILEDLTSYVSNSEHLQNAMWKHNKERLKTFSKHIGFDENSIEVIEVKEKLCI